MIETKKQASRYTKEELDFAKKEYDLKGNEALPEIADALGKTVNSVRAKLVREKIYIKDENRKKQKKTGPSKKEILRELEQEGLVVDGLENATKGALLRIKEFVQKKMA